MADAALAIFCHLTPQTILSHTCARLDPLGRVHVEICVESPCDRRNREWTTTAVALHTASRLSSEDTATPTTPLAGKTAAHTLPGSVGSRSLQVARCGACNTVADLVQECWGRKESCRHVLCFLAGFCMICLVELRKVCNRVGDSRDIL